MSLPPDVLDHIFSFLQSDPVALKACSESHPTLSQLVERHLYARITLYEDDAVDDKGLGTAEYTKLLIDRPYIVDYIRILEIKMNCSLQFRRHLDRILKILPILFNLKKVTLESYPTPLAWAVLPKRFRLALLDRLQLSTMQELCIDNIPDFPLSSLNHCNTIGKLTLRWWAPDAEAQTFLKDTCCIALHSLTIQRCSDSSLRVLIPWAQIRSLRTLIYDPCEPNFDLLSQLIESCSNCLTSLYIDLGQRCTSCSPRSDVSRELKALQSAVTTPVACYIMDLIMKLSRSHFPVSHTSRISPSARRYFFTIQIATE